MNDIFDKLLIRFLLTLFICLGLLIYKYAHTIFYPSAKKQVLKKIYPSENEADTLHIFGRLIGVGLIFSTLEFNEYIGITISTFHFFIWGSIGFCLYLLGITIMENIIFHNFEYREEVLKKKNMAYSMISFSLALCLAYLVRTVFKESESSLIILFIMWLFSIVLLGFSTKFFRFSSQMNFNGLMIQKSTGLGLSYSAFLIGSTIILTSCFTHEHHDITTYMVQVLLKGLLGILIFPIFRYGLRQVFRIQDPKYDLKDPALIAEGIYEGAVFITCALLTSIIVGQIHFGTIYPFF